MFRPILLPLFAILFSAAAIAQQPEGMTGAVMAAIESDGTLSSNGEEIAARALYVKLRPDFAGNDAARTVRDLAGRAGLEIRSASHLGFIDIPLAPALRKRIESMSVEQCAVVERAERELGLIIELHYSSDLHPSVAARLLMRLPEIEYAEPVYLPRLCSPLVVPTDPHIPRQPHLPQIHAFEAWDIWKGDTTMVIGMVDQGVDQEHEDLVANIAPNPGESGLDATGAPKGTNLVDDDGNGIVDDWRGANLTAHLDGTTPGSTTNPHHGTGVAGLAAATTDNAIGVAGTGYLCRFFPLKTARVGSRTIVQGYNGIIYCARRGMRVINVSWGDPTYSRANQDIITNLVAAYDVAIVAAAGNDLLYSPQYPAGYRGVLGVAGVDQQDILRTMWGEQVDVGTPVGLSTVDGNLYDSAPIATSFAAPVAAGVLALVRSRYPALTAEQAIAHLRLSSDVVDSVNPPEMFRLAGYGRLNALRAVRDDPFSHPALVIDSVWTTDLTGTPRTGFDVGERGIIRFRIRNILGVAIGPGVRIVTYREDSSSVTIAPTLVSLPELASGASMVPETGIGFEVRAPLSDRLRVRFELSAAGGYDDYQYEKLLFFRPYMTVTTPKLTVSLGHRGELGYVDYPAQTVGDGLLYEGKPILYEGGFIIATDSIHVVSNVRDGDPDIARRDFASVGLPTAANDSTITFSDAAADPVRRIGLEMEARMVTDPAIPGAVGIRMRVRNISGSRIDTLHVAMFQDWDLSSRDRAMLQERPVDRILLHGLFMGTSGAGVASGVASYGGESRRPSFQAITNNTAPFNLYDGFSQSEKWRAVSEGIGSTSSMSADASMVIGARLTGLDPGERQEVFFPIAVGSDMEENLRALQSITPAPTNVPPMPGPAGSRKKGALGEPRPNPGTTRIVIEATVPSAETTLLLHDILGRVVADLTGRLGSPGARSRIGIDMADLPTGVYHLVLTSAGDRATRTLIRTGE